MSGRSRITRSRYLIILSQQQIRDQHDAKAHEKRVGCTALVAVCIFAGGFLCGMFVAALLAANREDNDK